MVAGDDKTATAFLPPMNYIFSVSKGTVVRKFQSNPKHRQSQGEEIANSISHGIGLVGALIGTPFLIMHAVRRKGMPD
jgi:predicted membrane channel-forming protein YqfA (hemolysin III family)